LTFAAVALVGACASAGAPPGGPEDHEAPEIVKITPDSGATNAQVKSVEFQFDEVVSDRPTSAGATVSALFMISPRNGATEASWHRRRITVRPQKGFRPNTAYKVILLPGLADMRGNVRRSQASVLFSTGRTFPQFSIPGRIFDWTAQRPADRGYVEAISKIDTTIVYLAVSDSSGNFDVGPLPNGPYLVRGIIDQNNNRVLDRGEKWDSLTIVITDARRPVELDAIERDTIPPQIDGITVVDSVTLRITFDRALDPALALQPARIQIKRADSTNIEVAQVQWLAPFERARQARDSAQRADSLRAAGRGGQPPTTPGQPLPVLTPGGARPAPPPPKPSRPPPDRGLVATIASSTPLVPGTTYRLTARGVRNLLGISRETSRPFTVPKPAPPPRDSTKRPPSTDSTRRPPPANRPR
jgi:hypothetical protein